MPHGSSETPPLGATASSSQPPQQPAPEQLTKSEPQPDQRTEAQHQSSEGFHLTASKEDEKQIFTPGKPKEDEVADCAQEDDDVLLPEAQPSYPRTEVDTARATPRMNSVHVYGLDFLKTDHMNEIFSQFNHKYVEWINDSSANIIFKDATSAKKALESLSFPKVGDDPWRRTPDILVNEDLPPIFLQMRIATSSDVKQPKKSLPKAQPFMYAQEGRRQRSSRQRLYSEWPEAKRALDTASPTPVRRKPLVCEEELQKRVKRAKRFGVSILDECSKVRTAGDTSKPQSSSTELLNASAAKILSSEGPSNAVASSTPGEQHQVPEGVDIQQIIGEATDKET